MIEDHHLISNQEAQANLMAVRKAGLVGHPDISFETLASEPSIVSIFHTGEGTLDGCLQVTLGAAQEIVNRGPFTDDMQAMVDALNQPWAGRL